MLASSGSTPCPLPSRTRPRRGQATRTRVSATRCDARFPNCPWRPSGGSAWDSPPGETAMTRHKNRKQAIRDRMQAAQVPYAEAARRINAGKAAPVPVVHAFPGADDDVVCGHYDRHAGEYVSTDWDEVTCGDCHQARMERGRLADELAEAHAELARQFAADTATGEQPEQAFS